MKSTGPNFRAIGAAVAAIGALVVIICLWSNLVGYNEFQNWQVYQSAGGNVEIIDQSGYYLKFFGREWTYPRAMEAEYTQTSTPLSPTDDSIRATFNDGGTAQVSTYVRIGLPTTTDTRLMLHQQFSANKKNITDAVKAHLANCIKASGPVMSASENQASRKSEFNQIIEEQLKEGLFKMRRTEIELNDLSTIEEVKDEAGNKVQKEKKAKVQATEIVLGKNGLPVVIQESPLKHYGIDILQFSITEIDYDHTTLEQFAAKKKSYLAAEQAKAERQQEVQQRLMVEEKGRRQVADVQADENQKRERAIIQAQQAADVAVINKDQAVTAARQKAEVAEQARTEAETLRKIAEIKVQTAELDKKATIAAAEAQQKSIELGGGISEEKRVLAQIAATRDAAVAEALSKIKVPSVVFSGESGDGGGVTNNLMNFLLLKSTGILQEPPAAK
jgi:regulator of protease activity HflC (stomatin/prohibitin superfamily)